jgi:hypothetical protein
MKRTVGIVVGALLVIAVIAISMTRDMEAVDSPKQGEKGPVAIVDEVKGATASSSPPSTRANPPPTTTTDPATPTPVPIAGGETARARGLVLSNDEESRSKAQIPPGTIDKDGIQLAIRAVKPKIAECYEKALQHDPDLSGSLVVEFKIEGVDGGGNVTAGEINTSDMQAPFFEACVLKEVAQTPFPLPSGGGTVTVKYPFHFDQGEHAD